MQKSYKLYNNLLGWGVFAIALTTYLLTIEPTVSLWDCGEFISSAYKLEVGHPPGAPLFMLIGRIFSMFAPDVKHVAVFINSVSVFASAFTVLFLFWTITYLAQKLISGNSTKLSQNTQNKIVLLSGLIGSLSYTFTDTFWFSAVEAEVYASSSFFTAFVVWAILKWESTADEKYANRWLILIAYIMGLSIGVHLLNLLAIPAIVFIYYFKKYKVNFKGLVYASITAIGLLAFIMYGIIHGYVFVASKFELFFVNSLNLPFNSGLLFYLFFTFAALSFLIYYTFKKKKIVLNTIFTAITVILIGYSSYAAIIIRSNAGTPMNENKPDNILSLLSYLNREQYGERPLIYGRYFTADFQRDKNGAAMSYNKYKYTKSGNKYIKTKRSMPEYLYENDKKTFFPRMYSSQAYHPSAYRNWTGMNEKEEPTFFDNLKFFFKYQIGQMYFRYFMWNFVGKTNDIQSNGSYLKGNWQSGIPFIDNELSGEKSALPDYLQKNEGNNKYFFLPFFLGLFGLLYSYSNDKKVFSFVMLLFFFTGLAIVLYLNQTPSQARERDYAYAGSFYAFAVWIGLGALSVFTALNSFFKNKSSLLLTLVVTLSVPAVLAYQNWDDHNRSGRFTAREFAKNYLDSCDKNAILFTNGDNDTFPLWYMQEVEGYRTDIKVINISLLSSDWYINQARYKTYYAEPVPFSMPAEKYIEGKRDAVYVTNNTNLFLNEKFSVAEKKYKIKFSSFVNDLVSIYNSPNILKTNSKIYQKINNKNITPSEFIELMQYVNNEDTINKYNINKSKLDTLIIHSEKLLEEISYLPLPLDYAMQFVISDSADTQLKYGNGTINYLPAKRLCIKVDSIEIVKNAKFSEHEKNLFEPYLKWKINNRYIYKNELAVLEIIRNNKWKRPIYFSVTSNPSEYMHFENYLRYEGFVMRLVPYKTAKKHGYINSEILYDKLINKFSWTTLENKHQVFIDYNALRIMRVMETETVFLKLANVLIKENKFDKAETVLDKFIRILPYNYSEYNYLMLAVAKKYIKIGKVKKANKLISSTIKLCKKDIKYYKSLSGNFRKITKSKLEDAKNLLIKLIKLMK